MGWVYNLQFSVTSVAECNHNDALIYILTTLIFFNIVRGSRRSAVVSKAISNAREVTRIQRSTAQSISASDGKEIVSPFDDELTSDESQPDCEGGALVSQSDLQAINDDLDSRTNDGYNYDNCCNANANSCTQVDFSGKAKLDLCGSEGCIGCAQLAKNVEGIINTCSKNGVSQGQQDINKVPGMKMQVGNVGI